MENLLIALLAFIPTIFLAPTVIQIARTIFEPIAVPLLAGILAFLVAYSVIPGPF